MWLLNFVDVGVACGYRDETAQTAAFTSGASKVQWPKGKHNTLPSSAVDLYAYVSGVGAIMDHNHSPRCAEYYARIAGLLEAYCELKGYQFRWGGNWDGDESLDDQSFNDLMHFEIW
ncbi:M15 family metallopeptidase [Psychromonas sp. psych-6C06]|uniref:M15 family metallopeptidase n=1 Tax=Psychromonas sp. psych-6C06 TaxID=2058089 RepID=UPI001290277D|nr:M15 family metallopeptidase [Psychromonas sp. psych-6C06]